MGFITRVKKGTPGFDKTDKISVGVDKFTNGVNFCKPCDIYLYGCKTGSGVGIEFMNELSQKTGCTIHAYSKQTTGGKGKGAGPFPGDGSGKPPDVVVKYYGDFEKPDTSKK